tara:strand:+ start:4335 stop:5387 length:1053 start_codon:yes stop_codon:yes gene_type:complete
MSETDATILYNNAVRFNLPADGLDYDYSLNRYVCNGRSFPTFKEAERYHEYIKKNGFLVDFVMQILTTTANESFEILCQDYGTFNATIEWGDGTSSAVNTWDDTNLTHVYAVAGAYTVTIVGTFPNIYYNNKGDGFKITSVDNLGFMGWETLERAFYGCDNMTSFTTGNTELSQCFDFTNTFRNTTSLATIENRGFDAASMTSTSSMFRGSGITTVDCRNFDTEYATIMQRMFRECINLDGLDVSPLDTSSCDNINDMFRDCGTINVTGLANFTITALDATNDLSNFANGSTLPTATYDALLISWYNQTPILNMDADFGASTYTAGGAAENARSLFFGELGWTITDGGQA